jgi:hypothetical protein
MTQGRVRAERPDAPEASRPTGRVAGVWPPEPMDAPGIFLHTANLSAFHTPGHFQTASVWFHPRKAPPAVAHAALLRKRRGKRAPHERVHTPGVPGSGSGVVQKNRAAQKSPSAGLHSSPSPTGRRKQRYDPSQREHSMPDVHARPPGSQASPGVGRDTQVITSTSPASAHARPSEH